MIRNLLIVMFVSLFLISCGGSSGESNNIVSSGLYNPVGTWTVTYTPDIDKYEGNWNCAEPSTEIYTYTIEKVGDNFEITFYLESEGYDGPHVLTVDGDTYNLSQYYSYPHPISTTTEIDNTITFTSDDTFVGVESWSYSWDGRDKYCKATDNLIGIRKE